jgi:hypothetical protein
LGEEGHDPVPEMVIFAYYKQVQVPDPVKENIGGGVVRLGREDFVAVGDEHKVHLVRLFSK